MATLKRTGDSKPVIRRTVGGGTATLRPTAGTGSPGPAGPPGPAGSGATNADVAAFVETAGDTRDALSLAYTKARRRDIQTLGVLGDGTNEQVAIQAAHDAAYAGGYGLAYTPTTATGAAANYVIGAGAAVTVPILLDAIDMEVVKGATITRNYDDSGSISNALYRNRDLTTDIQGGYLSIEGRIRSASLTMDGGMFALRVSDLYIPAFICDQFAAGRVVTLSGDRILLGGDWHISGGTNAIGSAGLRFTGGTGFRTEPGGWIECGDDVLQFVPPGPTTDAFYGRDIIDCWFDGWSGISHTGKGQTCGLQNATENEGDAVMNQSILRSGWRNCSAQGSDIQIKAYQANSSGSIDVYAIDCHPDSNGAAAPISEVGAIRERPTLVTTTGTLGSCRLTLVNTSISNPLKTTAKITGDAMLRLRNCDLPKPSTVSKPTVENNSGRLIITGGTFDGGGLANNDVIVLGAGPAEMYGFRNPGLGSHAAINIATGGNLVLNNNASGNVTIALATGRTPAQVVTDINAAMGYTCASLSASRLKLVSSTSGLSSSIQVVSATGTILDNLGLWVATETGEAAHDCILDPTEITNIGQNAAGIFIDQGANNIRVTGRIRYSRSGSVTGTKGVEIIAGALGVRVAPGADYANVATAVSNSEPTASVKVSDTIETVYTVAASGAALTLPDVTVATIHDVTLTANCTFTLPTVAAGKSILVRLTQDATGSRTVTWPATVKWPGGTAPTLSTAAGKQDILRFVSVGGTNWSGSTVGLDVR